MSKSFRYSVVLSLLGLLQLMGCTNASIPQSRLANGNPMGLLDVRVLEEAQQQRLHNNVVIKTQMIAECPPMSDKTQDLKLSSAIDIALCHHPRTHQAWAKVKENESRIELSKTAYRPTVSVTYEARYFSQNQHDTAVNNNSHQFSINTRWLLLDFGEREAKLAAAIANFDAAHADFYQVVQRIIYEVSQHYEEGLYQRDLIHLNRRNESTARRSLELAKQFHQSGLGLKSDIFRAKTALDEAKLARLKANNAYRQAKAILVNALGVKASPNKLKLVTFAHPMTGKRLTKLKTLTKKSLNQHPNILAQHAKIVAAESTLIAIASENKPRIEAFNDLNAYQQTRGDSKTTEAIIGLRMSMPLYDGGVQRYQEAVQEQVIEQERQQLSVLENTMLQDIETSFYQLESSLQQYNTAGDILHNAQKVYDASLGRYRQGVGEFSEVLNAQRQIHFARQSRATAKHDWYRANLSLRYHLGNLTSKFSLN